MPARKNIDKTELFNLHKNEGLSFSELATRFSVSRQTIVNYMFGYPTEKKPKQITKEKKEPKKSYYSEKERQADIEWLKEHRKYDSPALTTSAIANFSNCYT